MKFAKETHCRSVAAEMAIVPWRSRAAILGLPDATKPMVITNYGLSPQCEYHRTATALRRDTEYRPTQSALDSIPSMGEINMWRGGVVQIVLNHNPATSELITRERVEFTHHERSYPRAHPYPYPYMRPYPLYNYPRLRTSPQFSDIYDSVEVSDLPGGSACLICLEGGEELWCKHRGCRQHMHTACAEEWHRQGRGCAHCRQL